MADHPIQDPVVQQAVSRVHLRSERQEDVGQLVDTFVDPGITVQLQNDNNQILYGRRGTGKTHVLKVVQSAAKDKERELALYVDLRRLGSSSVFTDEGRPLHVRVASLLKDVLAEVENGLLEWATSPQADPGTAVLETLDSLGEAITRTVVADAEIVTETVASTGLTRAASGGMSLGSSPAVTAGGSREQTASDSARVQETGRKSQPVYFQEIGQALDRVLDSSGLQRVTLLLDEWTAVPLDLQPMFAEFLKRTVFLNPRITVKIASLEYRSNFSEPLDRNNVMGFELGADVSSSLELDDYFVYDRNPDRTVEMFSELLFRHVAAETQSNGETSHLGDNYGIADSEQFVRAFFASRDAFQELVRAGEGVARDFINIFTSAFFNAVRRGRNNIDRRAVQEAAREWYEKDKAPNVDDRQARILRRIVDEVIGTRKARSFLLEKELEKNEVVRSLFDFRIIHLVQRGFADKDNPGIRYNIYTLDYGSYVDLLGTAKAPEGDFTEALSGAEDPVVVPFDDRRSIRRIILRAEHLETDDEKGQG